MEKIREALGELLTESARANDLAGRGREPDELARALYRAALVEVEAIERAHRLALEQVDNMREEVKRRAMLDHVDVIGDLWRLRRILASGPGGRT